jgi:hypothetical protein
VVRLEKRGINVQKTAIHAISFSGCSSGIYPLTWAQRAILRSIDQPDGRGTPSPVQKDGSIADVPDISDVLSGIRRVLARHEALRSYCRRGTGGGYEQVVEPAGVVYVDQYETTEDQVSGAMDELRSRLAERGFAEDEMPIRLALITVGGAPAAIVMLLNHLFADGVASAVVYEEILAASLGYSLPAPGWQPGEIAAYEGSEPGQAQAKRADAYLRRQLEAVVLPGEPVQSGEPKLIWARLHSRVVAAATALLRQRLGTSEANILLAAYLAVLGKWLGFTKCTVCIFSTNRFRPNMRRSVANLFQVLPLTVDTGVTDFSELVERVQSATLSGYRMGHYDPSRFEAALAEVSSKRGQEITVPYAVNLRLVGQKDFDGAQSREVANWLERHADREPAELYTMLGESRLVQGVHTGLAPEGNVRFTVWELADFAAMTVMGEVPRIPKEEPEALLMGLENLLLELAQNPFGHYLPDLLGPVARRKPVRDSAAGLEIGEVHS